MKTEDLIGLLASGIQPVDHNLLAKRFAVAMLVGLVVATLIVMSTFGVRADIREVVSTPLFWAKAALPACLMIGALLMLRRLARPGMSAGSGGLWVVAALVAVWLAGFYVLAVALPDTRMAIILGKTWRTCAMNITLLSIPGVIAVFWALRETAPTRPRLAGACAGLLAGSMATLAYCLHCPEMEIPFWAVWYVLGMFVPTALGALLGVRLLRW